MIIEAMKLALAALETCRIRSVSEWSVEDITPKNVTAAIAALHTAIQQAEAQQPATGEPVKGPHCTTCGASMDEPHHPACGALTAVIIGVNTMAAQDDRQRRRFLAKKIHQTLRGAITHPAPSAAVTPEPVEDGIRNAEDELNCAEEVLDAITCEFSDGEFPVTDFNCIGDYITAVVDVFKERLAARQPDTGEPVAWPLRARVWKRESTQEWVLEIAGTLGDTDMNIRHTQPLSVAYENVPGLPAFYTHPAPSVPADVVRDAERGRFLLEWLKRYGLLQAEFGQMGVGEKPENWWLLHAPWGIDQTRPFLGHGKTPEQAIDAAKDAT